jgi:hypothetical protein
VCLCVSFNVPSQASFNNTTFTFDYPHRSQFDKDSKDYHGGLTTTVPIGGARVPEGMKSEFPEGFDPSQPPVEAKKIEYGEKERERVCVCVRSCVYVD